MELSGDAEILGMQRSHEAAMALHLDERRFPPEYLRFLRAAALVLCSLGILYGDV